MFKYVLVCALIAVALATPIPDHEKSSGLTRPSPINPSVQSDPKPKDSGKIIPATLTDEQSKTVNPTVNKPVVTPVSQNQQKPQSRGPIKAATYAGNAGQATNVKDTKVSAPASSVQKIANPPARSLNNERPSVIAANHPAASLQSNPSIASPVAAPVAVPVTAQKSNQPAVVATQAKKVVKRDTPAEELKHLHKHHHTSTTTTTTTDSSTNSTPTIPATSTTDETEHSKSVHETDKSESKPLNKPSSSNDDTYNRDNQPPKYVHPVPVTQIIRDGPPAEIHQHKDE